MTFVVRTALCLLLALVPLAVRAQDSDQGDDKTVMVAPDDAEMAAAIAKARSSLDDFLALSEAPPPGTDKFKLKVMIVDRHVTGAFLGHPLQAHRHRLCRHIGERTGTRPQRRPRPEHRIHQGRHFRLGYTRDGHQVGSFTVCVMFKKMSKEEADYMRTQYGFDC